MTEKFETTWLFALGVKVKDTVTGFVGIITARIEYLNGCKQYCVEPKIDKEGKKLKFHYFDEEQIAEVPVKAKKKKAAPPPGGVMSNAPDCESE